MKPEANVSKSVENINKIPLGVLWILQAISSVSSRSDKLNEFNLSDEDFLQFLLKQNIYRLEEVAPQLIRALEVQASNTGYINHTNHGEELSSDIDDPDYIANRMMEVWFSELASETLKAKEKLSEADLVMIVGQQGVGKSVVVNYLADLGYEVVSMSEIVRTAISSWNLDQSETMDKIVGGQIFKEYFGQDVLLCLGVENLLASGITKIVVDGPRVVEEADAVLAMGGKLIGVVADIDPEKDKKIRKERIEIRAKIDASRKKDIINFENRERVEGLRIASILEKAEKIFVNKDINELSGDLNDFFINTKE